MPLEHLDAAAPKPKDYSKFDTFQDPLVERNASPEMICHWSPRKKFTTWRQTWVWIAESEQEMGLSQISEEALSQMRANINNIDFDAAKAYERKLRHDVMAHVHAYGDVAPAAKGIIHLGCTSMEIDDNAQLLIMREALQMILRKLINLIDAIGTFAEKHREMAALGFTHLQQAQPTTVGKRATTWAYDFMIALEEMETRLQTFKFRGLKGATGTQASFLELFDGDHEKVKQLDQLFLKKIDKESNIQSFPVTGQTYPRIVDSQIVRSLVILAEAACKMCNDLRYLSSIKEVDEPSEEGQVGSSAMAYKKNPMRCERATALSRYLMGLQSSIDQTAAGQFLERTLDDSALRRIVIPGAFLSADAILTILTNVIRGLQTYPAVMRKHLLEELPFLATEQILMEGVKQGGDRQEIHEAIRRHSRAAGENVKKHGQENNLVDLLKADPLFTNVNMDNVLDPKAFIGRAPEQTTEFINGYIQPLRAKYGHLLGMKAEVKV